MAGEEDAGHKAMLYYLEVLMNTTGALSISQLAGRFGSRTFTAEMRAAAGANERGLRKFFLRYPSLFKVDGNLVSLNDTGAPQTGSPASTPPSSSTSSTHSNTITDFSVETDAVLYFQTRLAKKEEKWVPIKSLAGHLSQASFEIRNCVGPQNEFIKFLLKHPHVFEVQGELVSLRDSFSSANYKKDSRLGASRPRNLKFATRSHSSPLQPFQREVTTLTPTKSAPLTMTANEYKAVMHIKTVIEKIGNMELQNLNGQCIQAPEGVRKTIGFTVSDLEEFLKNHDNMFRVDSDGVVSVKPTPKLHVIITGSRPDRPGSLLANRRGKIFHVAKLWGIIDLGKHEHVFFDKSIYHKTVEDFQAEFRVGEMLNFNAILAPKDSRAKWKATHVWKDGEVHPEVGPVTTEEVSRAASPSESIEDELCRLLPDDFEISQQLKDDPYPDATPCEPHIGFSDLSPRRLATSPKLKMVPEDYHKYAHSRDDLSKILPDDVVPVPDPSEYLTAQTPRRNSLSTSSSEDRPRLRTVGCQTISTGEIMATNLYHDSALVEFASSMGDLVRNDPYTDEITVKTEPEH